MRARRALSPRRLISTIIILTFLANTHSLPQKYLLCKLPGTQTCIAWLINLEKVTNDINEIRSMTNIADYCGLSDLIYTSSHRKFFKMKLLHLTDAASIKTMICKRITTNDHTPEWTEVTRSLGNTIRVRRQGVPPRGRYRGQTQSQYLAIDRGNGKDEGKAEAHSAADSSRASVSGNSGMGQAQSQSIYDPSCDDCYGKTENEVQNLKRPSGSSQGYIPISGGQSPSYNKNGAYDPHSVHTIGPSGGESYPPSGTTGSGGYPSSEKTSGGNYPPGGTNGGGSHSPSGTTSGGGYPPIETTAGGGYPPSGITSGGGYPTTVTTSGGHYPPSGTNGGGGYPSSGTNSGGGYPPSGTNDGEGYRPSGTTNGGGYPPTGTTSGGGYSPSGTTGSGGYPPGGTTDVGSYPPSGTTGVGGYPPGQTTGGGSYPPSGSTGAGGYPPGGTTSSGGYPPSGTTSSGGYPPGGTTGGGGYPSGGINSSEGYPPGGTTGGGSYPPSGTTGGGGYPPSGTTSGRGYPTGGTTSGGVYPPGGTNSDRSYPPGRTTSGGSYTPGGTTSGGAYHPGGTNGGGSYLPSENTVGGGYFPSGTTGGRGYIPGGMLGGEGYPPGGTAGGGGYPPVGMTERGGYSPSGTTVGGGYTPGEYPGGEVYHPNGISGGGNYPTSGTTGGGVYPQGGTAEDRRHTPSITGDGGGGYPTSGTAGGTGYPTTGGGYPTGGTAVGGGYPPGGTTGNRGYPPTGTTDGGVLYPVGTTENGGYRPGSQPGTRGPVDGTTGGAVYPPDGTNRNGGYSPSGTTGSGGYSPGGTSSGGSYPPSGTTGGGGYPPGGTTSGGGYPPSETTGGGGYPPGGTTSGGGYPPGETGGSDRYPSSGTTGGADYPVGGATGSGSYQPSGTKWPIASGPYPGPGGNNYFCCILPSNTPGAGVYPNTYGPGNGISNSLERNPLNGNQYPRGGVPNSSVSPQTNLEGDALGKPVDPSAGPYGISNNQSPPNGFYSSGNDRLGGPTNQVSGEPNGVTRPTSQFGGGRPNGGTVPIGSDLPGKPNGVYGQFVNNIPGTHKTLQEPVSGTGGPFLTGQTSDPNGSRNYGIPGEPENQYGTIKPGGPNGQNGYPSGPNTPGGQYGSGLPSGADKDYGNGGITIPRSPYGTVNNDPTRNFGIGPDGSYRPRDNFGLTGHEGSFGVGPEGATAVPGGRVETNIPQGIYGKDQSGWPYGPEMPGVSNEKYGKPNSNAIPGISEGPYNLPTTNNFGSVGNGHGPLGGSSGGSGIMGPNGPIYAPQGTPPAGSQYGTPPNYLNQGVPVQNTDYNGIPLNYMDPNSIAVDGDDSEAEASVAQAANGTSASASAKGGNDKARAQTNVHGTYTGSGSFQAQAQITGENKEAQSEVSGGKKGASSSASGSGRNNKSQATVQLGSETGSLQTQSQSNGVMHSSNSQVQGSVKGGMADAQARGPGSTSSQAQIGFTPYKDKDKVSHDSQRTQFVGGGVASAQSSGRTGQSQSQLHGTFKYGITYNGAAQSGASLDKDTVFPNRLSFEKIDVFDENEKKVNVGTTEESLISETESTNLDLTTTSPELHASELTPFEAKIIPEETTTEHVMDETMKNSESRYSSHTHLDHHKPVSSLNQDIPSGPTLLNSRKSYNTNYIPNTDYEFTTDKDENQPDNYDSDVGFDTEGNDATDVYQGDYSNYDEFTSDSPTHQSYISPSRKGLQVRQTLGGNNQQIVLGSLKNHNAEVTQKNSERPDETKVYQPGERIPGTGGYTIPIGFTGSVKSVASKDKTYVVGTRDSPSQAQTVTLTPGTGKVKYTFPQSHPKYIKPKNLRSLHSPKENNRYVSVSKSVTRALDDENNIRKQYSHTYYTKSSSCGYFTFTCTMVSSAEGRKKVCKPKIPTNPDGTPIRC